ncbi:hypothetical protein [Gordonia sp. (in: high G+C Gram-positive bacteria)]|uniref:hypothetical protein n=1 Tax=Gordonia sp. (in: high G+C Gram-positive bacteria) TaxID=84139 RepID=UPI003C7636BE
MVNHDPATEHDPVAEAAARAVDKDPNVYTLDAKAGAREALAPIRELHKPMTADERESRWLSWWRDDDGDICRECTSSWAVAQWPCPTAKLCYTTEELQ